MGKTPIIAGCRGRPVPCAGAPRLAIRDAGLIWSRKPVARHGIIDNLVRRAAPIFDDGLAAA